MVLEESSVQLILSTIKDLHYGNVTCPENGDVSEAACFVIHCFTLYRGVEDILAVAPE